MTIKELRDFIYENYFRQTGFTKESSYYSMKCQEKVLESFADKLTTININLISKAKNGKTIKNNY